MGHDDSLPPRKEEMFSGPVWILGMAYSSPGCVSLAHVANDSESCKLGVGLEQEKAFSRSRLLCRLLHHLDCTIKQT